MDQKTRLNLTIENRDMRCHQSKFNKHSHRSKTLGRGFQRQWAGLLTSFTLLALPANAAEVVQVHDGDSITIREGTERIRIRIACIDAPEITQYPYGEDARHYLFSLLPPGTEITYKPKAKDRFGRTVAEVFKNGDNIDMAMVASGNAFNFTRYIRKCDYKKYNLLEKEAKEKAIGVWSVPGGIERPWDFRESKKSTIPDN